MKKYNCIISPIFYMGNKKKLIQKGLIELFPKDIDCFIDVFAGSSVVSMNVKANQYYINDNDKNLKQLYELFKSYESESIINHINSRIDEYGLARERTSHKVFQDNRKEKYKSAYYTFREYYNKNKNTLDFYTLMFYSFSQQFRFNNKGEFNMPYGKRDYNISLQEKLKTFVDEMHKKDIQFWNKDFRECNFFADDFIYVDPPYYNSVATYNENGGWSEQDERDLLSVLDVVDKHGRFALSNNLKYDNPLLEDWKNKYNIHYLNGDYSNCNYQKKDKSADCEVLITNY